MRNLVVNAEGIADTVAIAAAGEVLAVVDAGRHRRWTRQNTLAVD